LISFEREREREDDDDDDDDDDETYSDIRANKVIHNKLAIDITIHIGIELNHTAQALLINSFARSYNLI
jgi:hypothetical protein